MTAAAITKARIAVPRVGSTWSRPRFPTTPTSPAKTAERSASPIQVSVHFMRRRSAPLGPPPLPLAAREIPGERAGRGNPHQEDERRAEEEDGRGRGQNRRARRERGELAPGPPGEQRTHDQRRQQDRLERHWNPRWKVRRLEG